MAFFEYQNCHAFFLYTACFSYDKIKTKPANPCNLTLPAQAGKSH
jgi:hypothetical protein